LPASIIGPASRWKSFNAAIAGLAGALGGVATGCAGAVGGGVGAGVATAPDDGWPAQLTVRPIAAALTAAGKRNLDAIVEISRDGADAASGESSRRETARNRGPLSHDVRPANAGPTRETTMDLYHIALYVHILAVIVASGATAITKLAAARRARARTAADALDWHNVLTSASKTFPIVLAVFVLTGAFMLSRGQSDVWGSGFVVAGLAGVVLLFASGTYLGLKGKALGGFLQSVAAKGADQPAPRLVPPPMIAALPAINTGIALAVAFDMVTKPASIPVALGVVALGIVISGALVARGARRAAPVAKSVVA
jgi:hypothetical protein